MSLEDLGLPSREELLSGGLAPGRRATALLFAIESRTARLVVESQELTAVHLTERAVVISPCNPRFRIWSFTRHTGRPWCQTCRLASGLRWPTN